jgi:arachidonate 15-lipoxygenase
MLPSRENALVQVNILTLLGSVYYRALGDYRSNRFPYLRWFEDPAIVRDGGPLDRFQAALRAVQTTIETRNTARIPYTFLLPTGIPNSINI